MLSKYLLIGEVLKPQGARGEVKVRPYTDDPERFKSLKTVYMEDNQGYHAEKMRFVRVHDGMVYLLIGDADSMDDAEKLRGQKLYVDRANAVALREDEEFICDLIGCEAFDEKGNKLGVLKEILTDTPTDVYVFETHKGRMMLPALKAAIPVVDVKNRRMVLNSEKFSEVAVFDD